MSIREVYVGPSDNSAAQYVLLQMYESGQNFVSGHSITVYDSAGSPVGTYTFASDVSNGANQAYIWIATGAAEILFGISADLAMAPTLAPAGGKVCFDVVDCFSWGSYSGDSVNPSPSGNPFSPTTGLTPGTAASRDISGGSSPNAIEADDDTNDSAADFSVVADPVPVNNAGDDGSGTPDPGGGYGGGGGGGGGGYGGGGGGAPGLSLLLALVLLGAAGRVAKVPTQGNRTALR